VAPLASRDERRLVYATMLLVALPRVMLGHSPNHGATAIVAWALVGLTLTRRPPIIPTAIVARRPAPRAHRYRG